MVGNDAMYSLPAFATARRGLARNVQGYTHYGNYDWSNPVAGNVNALVPAPSMSRWNGGAVARNFSHRSAVPWRLEPIVAAQIYRQAVTTAGAAAN
jgi:hypothetical protein